MHVGGVDGGKKMPTASSNCKKRKVIYSAVCMSVDG
jgi:hypothetical protein